MGDCSNKKWVIILTPQNGINGSTPKIGFLFRLKPVEYSHATCFVFRDVNEREQCCQRPVRTKPIHTHSQNVHHTSGHSPILIHKPELTQCSFKNMLFHGKSWFMLEFHEWIVVPNIGEYMLVSCCHEITYTVLLLNPHMAVSILSTYYLSISPNIHQSCVSIININHH